MTGKKNSSGPDEARGDLEEVAKMEKAAKRRGSFPLGFAFMAAAWVGLMTTMVLEDYQHTLWFFILGALVLLGYRQKKGAWIIEFREKNLSGVLLRLLGGLAIVGGGIFLAKAYPAAWAAKAIGAAFGLYIFFLLALAHGKTWAELKKGEK